jgi:uncharacterized protein YijF (DUF1287 family)
MNAPLFNITNIKSAYGSCAWVQEMVQETARCCNDIDIRISLIQHESLDLTNQMVELEKQLGLTVGFFSRVRLSWKMKSISRQIEWRRKVLSELWFARQRRTISW